MKIKALLLSAIAAFASATTTFAHDTGAAHDDARFAARNFSAQPPAEILEILRNAKGIPAADSDAIRALTARYLSRRSNRSEGANVAQTFLSADESKRGQAGMSASPYRPAGHRCQGKTRL